MKYIIGHLDPQTMSIISFEVIDDKTGEPTDTTININKATRYPKRADAVLCAGQYLHGVAIPVVS